ncbi:uncharacterized protein LOC120659451 [Panicum virgatum]|uniref:uncharacterized protein LOC120659451 n=1 Tax=Panicum virgatum TaxID=38727 RepID=UPI0019D66271|nr:uncharacterized protein LOC120659451 [Panicum virgatum]
MEHGCEHYRRRCKIVAPCCKQVFPCRHCHNEATVSGCPAAACVGPVRCRIESRHLELHRGRIGVRRLLLAALVDLGAFTNMPPSAGIDPLAAPLPSARRAPARSLFAVPLVAAQLAAGSSVPRSFASPSSRGGRSSLSTRRTRTAAKVAVSRETAGFFSPRSCPP